MLDCCRVNSNLDLIVSAIDLLKVLNVTVSHPRDHSSLSSTADLQELVAYSMEHCAGIERVFTDQKQFQTIVEAAKKLPHVVSERVDLLEQFICCLFLVPHWRQCSSDGRKDSASGAICRGMVI